MTCWLTGCGGGESACGFFANEADNTKRLNHGRENKYVHMLGHLTAGCCCNASRTR